MPMRQFSHLDKLQQICTATLFMHVFNLITVSGSGGSEIILN